MQLRTISSNVMLLIGIVGLAISFVGVVRSEENEESRQGNGRVIYCYLGSWANYRNGDGKFVIEDIDPFLCTHAAYAFAKLQDNEIRPYDPYLDLRENWGLGGYERFNALKNKNRQLKTFIAIGGWNEGSTKYSEMARNPDNRKRFVDSCVRFIQRYGFDGLDMDWEYPANRGGIPADKENFVTLLRELKNAFRPHGYLLTAAVGAGQSIIDSAYDIPGINQHLDLINVMAYDFHGGWSSKTGLNAPLYSRPAESEQDKKLNADYAIRYWLKKGASANKIVMGMGLYGRTFTLRDQNQNGLGAPITGNGQAGPYTREPGYMGYNEICENVEPAGRNWKIVFDDDHKAPYAYKERQWIGYDNKKSIAMKVNYIRKMNLAGGMVWSIETDDFRGKCDGNRYPLLNTIRTGFNNRYPQDEGSFNSTTLPDIPEPENETGEREKETAPRSPARPNTRQRKPTRPNTTSKPVTTPPTNTLPDKSDSSVCSTEGYVRHPSNCKQFYYCHLQQDTFVEYAFECAAGTVFNENLGNCDFPHQVPGCKE